MDGSLAGGSEASCQKHVSIMQIRSGDGQWTPGQVEGGTINSRTPEGPVYSVFSSSSQQVHVTGRCLVEPVV